MSVFSAAQLANVFGILGNIVSFLVCLAPVPTFYRIWKKKSTEGFQSIPYAVALFSAMLYLYYAFLKENVFLVVTINSVTTFMEIVYLTIFMIYATKKSRVFTIKLLLLFNVTLLGMIIACSMFILENKRIRTKAVGWMCAAFSVSVFAAPLSILRRVIKTKSVEFMPFSLSFFLTLCAVMWFCYGLLIHDLFIAAPNVLGFAFGIIQMILYIVYKRRKPQILPEIQVQESKESKTFDSEFNCNEHELNVVVIMEQDPDEVGAEIQKNDYTSETAKG